MSPKNKTLSEARKEKAWTQEQLALASGVDQRAISKIERGETADPLNSTAEALERALDLDRGTLVFGQVEALQ